MRYANIYQGDVELRPKVTATLIKFEGLGIQKKEDRQAFSQSIANRLNKKGIDAAALITPNCDLVLLALPRNQVEEIKSQYSNLAPKLFFEEADINIIEKAWQNRVRTELFRKGFIKVGDRYVVEKDILDKKVFKKAYRIQSLIINGKPSILLDLRTRIMIPLSQQDIEEADVMGDESDVKVRVLPRWTHGILLGRTGKLAGEMEFPLGNQYRTTPEYWKIKHDIRFVKADEEMLDVYVPTFDNTLPYPKSCVFKEYPRGLSLPEELKKSPEIRIRENKEFLDGYFKEIIFLGKKFSLNGPTSIAALGYNEYSYPNYKTLQVIVGGGYSTTVGNIQGALRKHGPYAGRINGKYIVLHAGDDEKVKSALKTIEDIYSKLNLGYLKPFEQEQAGKKGFIDTGGETAVDFTATIAELKSNFSGEKVLVIIVLPQISASQVYYKSRANLFESTLGLKPMPCQAILKETIESIVNEDRSRYPSCVNLASQSYVKLGGTGAAVWLLREPADIAIPGINPGSSCYAYHDVSRRPKLKASATAYSAMTDSYGRYIATGTKPIGGEKLTPSGFYDILVELLQKISMFSQRYGNIDREKRFKFERLVFAKDGVIKDDEAEMMEQVILHGIPEENKDPIKDLLKRRSIFPRSLIIDIIGVNKTPNWRIYENAMGWKNVPEGVGFSYNATEGLLISASIYVGTNQPIEISLKKHLALNREAPPTPHISQIMEEYHRMTYLDWASIFRQGKYALPQILTQNLGENISAGVLVPDDMILL